MLNYIWLGLMVAAVLMGAWNDNLGAVSKAAFERAEYAVMNLALPLAGVMALWLGVMRLAEKAGLIQVLAHALRPIMRRLFPDVPPEHPAMGSMLMNMAANILGLNNAATPLGIRAMKDLESLNQRPGVATNAMCTFLTINTGSFQLVPATAVGILAVAGSVNPTAIVGSAIMSSLCATFTGISVVKLLEKLPGYRLGPVPVTERPKVSETESPGASATAAVAETPTLAPLTWKGIGVLILFLGFFAWTFLRVGFPEVLGLKASEALVKQNAFLRVANSFSLLTVPFLLSFFPFYAFLRKVKVYEQFVEGAKEGFKTSVMIIPYLVAILVAVGMFRAAGGIEMITSWVKPALDFVHFPSELLPLCLVRPLSGGGAQGLFAELVKQFGPDTLIARTAGTIYGSTETTFYIIAVYFGAVNVHRTRHAVAAGLLTDLAGMIASVTICRLMFG
jgi:spore maturation protein SpmA